MPHLIFQTKFPMHEQVAEITFFGCIERETMEALQQTTAATLQRNATGTQEPVGVWRQSPYSGHVVHFVVNVPGNWQLRHTLQNILRVAWMDIFDKAGWTVMSMWNCNSSASMAGVTPGGASDKAFAVPPPPPHPAATIGGGQKDGPPKKEAGDAAAAASEAVDGPSAAPSSEAATRPEAGAGGGDDGARRDAAGNKAEGGASGHKERATGEVEKFEGECANFLLFKAGTASGVGGLVSPHVTTLEASLFLGGMSAAHSESAAQQLMLASLPWLGAKAAPVDSGSSPFGGASSSACAAMPGGGATKGKGRAAQNPAAMAPGDGAETEKALRLSGSRSHENPTDELLVAATMAAAAAEREASGVASSHGGKRKASGTSEGGASGAGDSSRSGSATKKRKVSHAVLPARPSLTPCLVLLVDM